MSTPLIVAVVAAVVLFVIIRRFRGEPLNAKDLLIPPIPLLVIGVQSLLKHHPTALDWAWTGVALCIGFALGVWRGTTTRLLTRDGVLWQRYTASTLGVWAVSLVVSVSVGLIGTELGAHTDARPIQLSIGVSLLGEALALGLRGLATGFPFAPERVRKTGSPLEPIPVERQRLRAAISAGRIRSATAEWQRTGTVEAAVTGWRIGVPTVEAERRPRGE
ncbi:DUF1453 family protein [Nocardia sp. CDC159]|uniref:DUF1453 family protein n=1 Tax=Nocardia pulmonis TaxID=2951408 RepID=A0A9X2IWT1_9NOCA|nr:MULTISPECIES: CcdC protein domain-containing protein [Nocardia]MCM6775267.1 DUF1453 family protein [Nocardia pulmonis]MCM6787999.1 DUF1453 family protein [Nocardia sp. CDC159]